MWLWDVWLWLWFVCLGCVFMWNVLMGKSAGRRGAAGLFRGG